MDVYVVLVLTFEPKNFESNPISNDLFESDECPAYNKENVAGADLDIFLVRMFTPTLWGYVAGRAF